MRIPSHHQRPCIFLELSDIVPSQRCRERGEVRSAFRTHHSAVSSLRSAAGNLLAWSIRGYAVRHQYVVLMKLLDTPAGDSRCWKYTSTWVRRLLSVAQWLTGFALNFHPCILLHQAFLLQHQFLYCLLQLLNLTGHSITFELPTCALLFKLKETLRASTLSLFGLGFLLGQALSVDVLFAIELTVEVLHALLTLSPQFLDFACESSFNLLKFANAFLHVAIFWLLSTLFNNILVQGLFQFRLKPSSFALGFTKLSSMQINDFFHLCRIFGLNDLDKSSLVLLLFVLVKVPTAVKLLQSLLKFFLLLLEILLENLFLLFIEGASPFE